LRRLVVPYGPTSRRNSSAWLAAFRPLAVPSQSNSSPRADARPISRRLVGPSGQHRTAAASLGVAGLPARLPSLRFSIYPSRLRNQDAPSRRLVGPCGPTSRRVPLAMARDLLVYSSRVICQILPSPSLSRWLTTLLARPHVVSPLRATLPRFLNGSLPASPSAVDIHFAWHCLPPAFAELQTLLDTVQELLSGPAHSHRTLPIALSAAAAIQTSPWSFFVESAVSDPLRFLFDARVPCGPMVTLRQAATLSRKRSAARCCALFFDPALIRDKKRAAAPPFSFCESTGTPKKALFLDKIA
jgi:hypothetical protein